MCLCDCQSFVSVALASVAHKRCEVSLGMPRTSRQKLWKQVSRNASASGLTCLKHMLHTVPACICARRCRRATFAALCSKVALRA